MKIVMVVCMLFLVISCGKHNTIKVTAKNAATGEGFADLGFRIYRIRPYTTPTGQIQDLVYEGNFNNNGEAVVDLPIRKNRTYKITTISPGPMCYINNTSYTFGSNHSNFKFDFLFAPCAYSRLIINNVNCEGPDDKFVLHRENQIGSIDGSFGWEHLGCAYWETNGYSEIPMGEVYFRWEVIRSGITEVFYDTVFYPPGEYTTYGINY